MGGLRLRGIIDRLELDADGGLVVTDYKSGRAPGQTYQQGKLGGVAFYSLLCEELFGVRPTRVQLLYLGDTTVITTEPTEQSTRGLRTKVSALWQAVEQACEREDFRPRPGPLCTWCDFHAYCPAQGGDQEAGDERGRDEQRRDVGRDHGCSCSSASSSSDSTVPYSRWMLTTIASATAIVLTETTIAVRISTCGSGLL